MNQAYRLLQLSYDILGEHDARNQRLLRDVLEEAERYGDASCQAHCLLDMAYFACGQGNYQEAEKHCAQALACFEEVEEQERVGSAILLHEGVRDCLGLEPNKEALERALKLFRLYDQSNYQMDCSMFLANLSMRENDQKRAKELYSNVLSLFQDDSKSFNWPLAHKQLATIALQEGEFEDAVDHIVKALEAFRLFPIHASRIHEANCHELLGDLFVGLGVEDRGMFHYDKALQVTKMFDLSGKERLEDKWADCSKEEGEKTAEHKESSVS